MKITAHFVLAAVALVPTDAGYIVQQSTASSNSSDCSYACTDEYVPVCGSDGVTYSNECSLNLTNCESQALVIQVSDGECEATGSTSETYETSAATSGSKGCPEVCPLIYKPVCGSDGVTYGNNCQLGIAQCKSGRAITQVSDGQCPSSSPSSSRSGATGCSEVCIEIYEPVCGSDGVTYDNSCYLGIATCKEPSVTQASDGACVASDGTSSNSVSSSEEGSGYGDGSSTASSSSSGCPEVCLAVYKPVCGSDGVTYGNECELEVASCNNREEHITKVSDKACSSACKTYL